MTVTIPWPCQTGLLRLEQQYTVAPNIGTIDCMQAKAMQQGPDTKAAANGTSEPALPGANFGPKYEAHVSEMQNKLDEASKR